VSHGRLNPSSRARIRFAGPERDRADLAFWIAVPLCLLLLLVLNRHQWFRGDEFDFIVNRRRLWGAGAYADTLFLPHNEHWSTGPLVAYLGLFRLFRFSTYVPYLVLVSVVHVTFALALRAVLLRAGYVRWLANASTIAVLLLGSAMENIGWAFQFGFLGGVALGMVALVLSDHDGPLDRRDVLGVALLIASLTFSGTALTMLATVAINALWHRRWPTLAAYGALPAALYGLWYLGWGRTASRLPVDLVAVQPYVWRGIAASIDALTQLPGAASVLAVLTLVGLVWRAREGRLNGLVVSCALGAFVFFAVSGVSRASLGLDQASSPRYVSMTAGLLMPAIVGLLDDLRRRNPVGGDWVVAALLAWSVLGNLATGGELAREFADVGHRGQVHLAAAAALPSFRALDANAQPDPVMNPNIDIASLRDMLGHDGLVLPPSDPAAMLESASVLEVRAGTGRSGDPADASLATIEDTTGTPDGRCVRLHSPSRHIGLVLRAPAHAEIAFTEAQGPWSVRLLADGGLTAQPPAGASVASLTLDHPDYPVEVSAPSITGVVCGAHLETREPGPSPQPGQPARPG
jgi:hypothetical protein